MKNKKIKENKTGKISKRTIGIGCALAVVTGLITATVIFIGLGGSRLFESNDLTVTDVVTKMKASISEYKYALQSLDIKETVADEGTTISKYMLSASRETKDRTYLYTDSKENELYQCWSYDEEAGKYVIYINDPEYNVWVKLDYESEPVTGTPWSVFDNLDNYTLLDETQNWYTNNEECYVLETIGKTDTYEVIYEQVFIRKKDFIPLGIVTYGVSDVNYDKMQSSESIDLDIDEIESADVEIPTYSECIQMYEVSFSNDDLKMFDPPEDYLTEEEYLALTESEDE
jgi:hypothetical protein